MKPLTGGRQGLELVKILEAASASLEDHGAPVTFARPYEALPSLERRGIRELAHAEPVSAVSDHLLISSAFPPT